MPGNKHTFLSDSTSLWGFECSIIFRSWSGFRSLIVMVSLRAPQTSNTCSDFVWEPGSWFDKAVSASSFRSSLWTIPQRRSLVGLSAVFGCYLSVKGKPQHEGESMGSILCYSDESWCLGRHLSLGRKGVPFQFSPTCHLVLGLTCIPVPPQGVDIFSPCCFSQSQWIFTWALWVKMMTFIPQINAFVHREIKGEKWSRWSLVPLLCKLLLSPGLHHN